MSIWNGISRLDFVRDVSELERIAPSQSTPDSPTPVRKEQLKASKHTAVLSEERERQLTDDLAFLAAWESAPACVTAATVSVAPDSSSITVNLAANGGITPKVKETISQCLEVLQQCALCSVSRDAAANDCLQIVVSLQCNRILGRLGSPEYIPPKVCAHKKIVATLPRLLAILKQLKERRLDGSTSPLITDIERLRAAISVAEQSPSEQKVACLSLVSKAAYTVMCNGKSLYQRLIAAGLPVEYTERREVRQILALGNYWRACQNLSVIARRLHKVFSNCSLNTLPTYTGEKWPLRSNKRRFVHAEIQLLVHHDIRNGGCSPRHIGVSKKACFLCHCFIREHGVYRIPQTHGEMHSQWTVPESPRYSSEVRSNINRALAATHKDVVRALQAAKTSAARSTAQVQSAVDSVVPSMSAASATTIRQASLPEGPADVDALDDLVSSDQEERVLQRVAEVDSPEGNQSNSYSDHEGSHHTLAALSSAESRNIHEGSPANICKDWLTLFVELEDKGSRDEATRRDHQGKCQVGYAMDSDATSSVSQIDVSSLNEGTTMTLERQDEAHALDLVFSAAGKTNILASFSWASPV